MGTSVGADNYTEANITDMLAQYRRYRQGGRDLVDSGGRLPGPLAKQPSE